MPLSPDINQVFEREPSVVFPMWYLGICSAFSVKLSSSIDDVVWLAPFLTRNDSWRVIMTNSAIYSSVCMIQTVVAMGIAYSGRAAVEWATGGSKHTWSTEKILTVGAGALLTLYAIKLVHEYIQEMNEENDEKEGAKEMAEKLEANSYKPQGGNDDEDAKDVELQPMTGSRDPSKSSSRQQTLFVIAFIGSVDDLTLFVPMLAGKGFNTSELMLGALAATGTILAICIFIGQCKPLANCLGSVPLAAIVGVFACMLLLRGFFME